MHALVIEDELIIATEIEFVLRECGFATVDIARSSEAAVDAAAANKPDLITADFDLRPDSGIETVRAGRADNIRKDRSGCRMTMPETSDDGALAFAKRGTGPYNSRFAVGL